MDIQEGYWGLPEAGKQSMISPDIKKAYRFLVVCVVMCVIIILIAIF